MLKIESVRFRVCAFISAIIALILWAAYLDNYTFLLTYFIFASSLIFIDKLYNGFTLYYFNVLCFFSVFLAALFLDDHNSYWNGPDDELFYKMASQGGVKGVYLGNINFFGYYIFSRKYYELIHLVIDSRQNFFHGILLSCVTSSFIPFFIKKTYETKMSQRGMNRLMIIVLFLPQFLIYNVTYLRDSYVMLLFVILLFWSSRKKQSKYMVLIYMIVLVLGYSIRPASSFFLGLYIVLGLIFSKKKFIILLLPVIIGGYFLVKGGKLDKLQGKGEKYLELAEKESSSNSLGYRLLNNNNPVFYPVKFLYVLFSPIPPEIIYKASFKAVFFSMGSFILYFYLIAFFAMSFFGNRDSLTSQNYYFNLTYICIVTVLVLLSSKDPRHLRYFFLLIFFHGINFVEENMKFSKAFTLVSFLLIPIIIYGYISIKY